MEEIGGVICELCKTEKCDCPRYLKEEEDENDKKDQENDKDKGKDIEKP